MISELVRDLVPEDGGKPVFIATYGQYSAEHEDLPSRHHKRVDLIRIINDPHLPIQVLESTSRYQPPKHPIDHLGIWMAWRQHRSILLRYGLSFLLPDPLLQVPLRDKIKAKPAGYWNAFEVDIIEDTTAHDDNTS